MCFLWLARTTHSEQISIVYFALLGFYSIFTISSAHETRNYSTIGAQHIILKVTHHIESIAAIATASASMVVVSWHLVYYNAFHTLARCTLHRRTHTHTKLPREYLFHLN